MKSCTICDKPVIARGWCSSHYNRWWRHGSPTAGRVSPGLSLATLTTWVEERHRGDCWKWLWAENGVGYGVVNVNGRQGLATHFALLLDGQAPSSNGLHALHSCDNPPCVNPDIFAGERIRIICRTASNAVNHALTIQQLPARRVFWPS